MLDDDPTSCELIAAVAEHDGFSVRTACDVQAFLRLFDNWHPSHITLDVHLDSVDGVQVIRALSQRRCRAAVTIVSAAEQRVLEAVGQVAREHGLRVHGVRTKPYDHAQLGTLLRGRESPMQADVHSTNADAFAPDARALRDALARGEFVP